jgi:two-component system sensor histidine kinase ChvG
MALGTSDRDDEAVGPTHSARMRTAQESLLAAASGVERFASAAWRWIQSVLKPMSGFFSAAGTALARTPPGRYITSSLLRRIVMSNLLGLAILFIGALYLSQFNIWLIDSKRENLQVRAATIANALATDTTTENSADRDSNPFVDFELKLDPSKVAYGMRRYLEGVSDRARVYSLAGDLIHDSKRAVRLDDSNPASRTNPKTKNFWTRLTQKLLRSNLRVYKDPGHGSVRTIGDMREAFKGKTVPMILLNTVGQQLVSIATPVMRNKEVIGVLLLSTHPREIDEVVDEQSKIVLAFAFCALAAAMIASYLLAQTVAGPMRKLSEVAEDVTRNIHSAAQLPSFDERRDEVGRLTRAFKAMTASLYGRIEASEKFAADVAHELKNPLAAARSTAQAFDYAKTDEQREMLVRQIQEEITRLNMLITDVSNASRLDADLLLQKSEPIDLVATCQDVVNTFADLLSETEITVRLSFDDAAHASGAYVVTGQEGRLGQVLTNLVDNAISFSPKDGNIDVRLRREGSDVFLIVEDEGPGIDPEQLGMIFNRFYTYRPEANSSRGNNSGLGLSITREIIRAHGGEILAENRPLPADTEDGRVSGGARFIVRLAAVDQRPPRGRLSRLLGSRSAPQPQPAATAK